jgi:diguanylate cyclase (GGDEF)-like protein
VTREAGQAEAAQYLVAILGTVAATQALWTLALLPLPTILIYQAYKSAKDLHEQIRRRELEHQAMHDSLTGLPNRSLFHDRLRQAVLRSQREASPFAVFLMDLNRFKQVNDTYGHHHGDAVLQEVARRVQGVLRESDTVARLGGDEFALLLQADAHGASLVASRIIDTVERPVDVAGDVLKVGASIGVALAPTDGLDPDGLLDAADAAMYAAKRSGAGSAYTFAVMAAAHQRPA